MGGLPNPRPQTDNARVDEITEFEIMDRFYVDKVNHHTNEWAVFDRGTNNPVKESSFLEANIPYTQSNRFGYRKYAQKSCDGLNSYEEYLASFTDLDFLQEPHCFPPEYSKAENIEDAKEIESDFWSSVGK